MMANRISVTDKIEAAGGGEFVMCPFYFDSKPLENAPKWGMTLLKAGSMRFRWNETNENRKKLEEWFGANKLLPIELIHSKIVVRAENPGDTDNVQGDGIVTKNRSLVPTVTVADCVPIFLYDTETGAFGIFHSGWKGTGIAGVGVEKMAEWFGSRPERISAAIGPHIGSCCYAVDGERAKFFAENFGENSVSGNNLSLTEANTFVLKQAGVKEENIVVADDCTYCSKFVDGRNVFGSFRREAAFLSPKITPEERSKLMTVQAAFITH